MYIEFAENGDVVMDWEQIANLTHGAQVEYFGFCSCEDGDRAYLDCPDDLWEDVVGR
jgi:hypothetical protein